MGVIGDNLEHMRCEACEHVFPCLTLWRREILNTNEHVVRYG